jgi:hypothetical protein
MCVVLQRDLGKGDAALSRCIPLASGVVPISNRISAIGETSLSPNPIDKGDCRSPFKPIASGGDFILPRHPHDCRDGGAPLDTIDIAYARVTTVGISLLASAQLAALRCM